MEYKHITHKSIPPFIDEESNVLILGSLPSIVSREKGFFYMHPTNRFYKLLAAVFKEEPPITLEERKHFLKRHKIALYDVIYECDIKSSQDSSIKNAVPIDIESLLKQYPNIKKIFTTGNKAKELFDKYLAQNVNIPVINLPSSSAANASMKEDELVEKYLAIKD